MDENWRINTGQVFWCETRLLANQDNIVPYPKTKSPPSGGWLIHLAAIKLDGKNESLVGEDWMPATSYAETCVIGRWTFKEDGIHLIGLPSGDTLARIVLTPLW